MDEGHPDDEPASDGAEPDTHVSDEDRVSEGGVAPEDDLEQLRRMRARRTGRITKLLALLVAIGLVVPAGRWAFEELRFRLSSAAVVETLEGEVRGAALADTVLLVRTAGCAAGTSGSGSAFVLQTADGPRLITNRHVVDRARRIGLGNLDGSETWRVTGVGVSEVADVAVLEVEDPATLPVPLALADEPATAGAPVRLVGYPAARPFTTEGTVARAGERELLLRLQVDRGASGSPVVTEQGRVVGQVYAVTGDGLGVATPAARLPEAVARTRPMQGC